MQNQASKSESKLVFEMLYVAYSCVTKTSYIALAVNVLLTIYLGIQMPNSRSMNWILSKCFDRPRSASDPPFFFREVRIGMLVVSMLFNLGRLIYEATVKDISVILVTARLCFTMLQLVDHWWFCKNWESFFIEKKMRAYIWFRLFVAVCMLSMTYCVLRTFPPYTNDSRLKQLKIDAFQWAAGLQVFVWYLWGKRWDFNWGDMSDERRVPAYVGALLTSSLIYALMCIYLKFTTVVSFQAAMTAGITGTIAYFLLAIALRYLNIVTIRSSQACRRILDESIVASAADGRSHGTLPLAERENSDVIQQPSLLPSLPPIRRNSNLMNNLRQSLDSRVEPSSQPESSTAADIIDRIFGKNVEMIAEENRIENVDEHDEEKGNMDEKGNDINRVRFKPVVSPSLSRNDSLSHIDGSNNSIALNIPHDSGDNIGNASVFSNVGGVGVDAESVRVKPNNSHTHSTTNSIVIESSGPPLCDITDHLVIDRVNIPLIRRYSLEANLATYETAHLLIDKVAVVFVQVKLT